MKILVIAQMRSRAMWFLSMLTSHHLIKNMDAPYLENNIEEINSILKKENNYGIKLETTDLYNHSLDEFNVDHYDQIYTLRRHNLADLVCSLKLVEVLDIWHYWPSKRPIVDLPTQYIDFVEDNELIMDAIKSYRTIELVEKYLHDNKLPFVSLTYDTVVEWTNENLKRGKSQMIDSEYNYSKLFGNYVDLYDYIEQLKIRHE